MASRLLVWVLVAKFEGPNSLWLLFWTILFKEYFWELNCFIPFQRKSNYEVPGDLLDGRGNASMAMTVTEQRARKMSQIPEQSAVPDIFVQPMILMGLFMLSHN